MLAGCVPWSPTPATAVRSATPAQAGGRPAIIAGGVREALAIAPEAGARRASACSSASCRRRGPTHLRRGPGGARRLTGPRVTLPDEGLGRLHGRRAPAGAAADHRAAPAAGTRSRSPRATTGRRSASSSGSGSRIRVVGQPRGRRDGQGAGARAAQRRPAGPGRGRRFDLALSHGSVDLALVARPTADPGCRCRTTSTPGCSARSRSAWRAGDRARCDPGRADGRAGAGPRASCSATRASRRTTTCPTSSPTTRCSPSSGRPATGSWSWCDRRRRPRPTTPTTPLYERVIDRLAADPERSPW